MQSSIKTMLESLVGLELVKASRGKLGWIRGLPLLRRSYFLATYAINSVSDSAQDGILALGKAHRHSAVSFSSVPNVALETVPVFCLVEHRSFSTLEGGMSTTSLPAKWLCDASSVLVGVWLLVTLRFQPSPLASKLLAALPKGEQSVSLSLPVHSLSTASPMQCLLVAAGVYGCRKAPEPNCKGEISMTQQ